MEQALNCIKKNTVHKNIILLNISLNVVMKYGYFIDRNKKNLFSLHRIQTNKGFHGPFIHMGGGGQHEVSAFNIRLRFTFRYTDRKN
jgi:hypothetical protein